MAAPHLRIGRGYRGWQYFGPIRRTKLLRGLTKTRLLYPTGTIDAVPARTDRR
jgi:hypothetical protein